MSTYRLPDALGGAEVEICGTSFDSSLRVDIDLPGLGRFPFPQRLLVEVKPPLPPEPEAGAAVVVRNADGTAHNIFQRDDVNADDAGNWFGAGIRRGTTWENLHASGRSIIRLVPDPAADAPPLPAVLGTSDTLLNVDRSRHAGDVLILNGVGLAQNDIHKLMAICARALKPGAERDELLRRAAEVAS